MQSAKSYRQDDIVLAVFAEDKKFLWDVDLLLERLTNDGLPERKRRRATIQTVLSRLVQKEKLVRIGNGKYLWNPGPYASATHKTADYYLNQATTKE